MALYPCRGGLGRGSPLLRLPLARTKCRLPAAVVTGNGFCTMRSFGAENMTPPLQCYVPFAAANCRSPPTAANGGWSMLLVGDMAPRGGQSSSLVDVD